MINERLGFPGRWALASCCALICSLSRLRRLPGARMKTSRHRRSKGRSRSRRRRRVHDNVPLANYGYTEEEYFISGTGYTYNTSGAVNVTGTKIITGGPNGNGTYPFKTRIVVRRPANPADFNGKVLVEWQNVTAGFDLAPQWDADPYSLIKQGYAYSQSTLRPWESPD